jgi:HK97 family phage prohead protease
MSTKIIVPRPPEYKAISYQVKATDDKRGIVEGFLNVIGNVDDGDDRTMSGAFKKTLNDSYAHKSAQSLEYLWPYLWSHDPDEPPIGGIFDADEVKAKGNDPAGLFIKTQLILDITRARDVYACFKGDTSNTGLLKQSMGYKTIRYEYVNEKGKNIRNLLEVAVWEGSAVVFPMNDLSVVTSVKSRSHVVPELPEQGDIAVKAMEIKGVCGNTSGTIGPRDEAWDGAKAKGQIWDAAVGDDGTISTSIAKKYFMYCDGDGSKKGDFSYPFWYVGDGPHICVGAVKAIANAVQGARDASPPDGLKSKVEKLYNRINKKYGDATPLVPPWKDGDKRGNSMSDRKDFNALYQDAQAADAYEDWSDLINAFTGAMTQAFTIGDTPGDDMKAALDQFGPAVLAWTEASQKAGLTEYLTDQQGGCIGDSPYIPYSMRMGCMSQNNKPDTKSGATFSAATQEKLDEHVKGLKDMSKTLTSHAKDLDTKANDLTELYRSEGQGPAFASDSSDTGKGNATQRQDSESKTSQREERRGPSSTPTREEQPEQSTEFTLDDLEALLV